MPAYQYLQAVPQEDTGQLKEQLERELAECTEILPTHRNKLRAFMEDRGIWHICGLDYPARAAYEQFLKGQFRSMAYLAYLKAIGLRISEVCTLKGNAYYIQGKDAWVQVYQTKMRSYKRIPIPYALYRLMMVYLKKHQVGPDDYAFQSSQGEAYRSATFRMKMQECCEKNGIKGGESKEEHT